MGLLYLRNKETGVFEPVRVLQGPPGYRGAPGEDGRGIVSVTPGLQLGNLQYYDITFTDGEVTQFSVYNGEDGSTPVKGVDYFTEEDIAEIVERVVAQVPPSSGETLQSAMEVSF